MTTTHRTLHAFDARSLLLFASLTLCSSAAVLAQPAPGALFGDTNAAAAEQDQQIISAEHSFSRADADGDGVLTREETAQLPAVLEKFDQWDHDGDGKISRQEFLNAARAQGNQ